MVPTKLITIVLTCGGLSKSKVSITTDLYLIKFNDQVSLFILFDLSATSDLVELSVLLEVLSFLGLMGPLSLGYHPVSLTAYSQSLLYPQTSSLPYLPLFTKAIYRLNNSQHYFSSTHFSPEFQIPIAY